MAEDYQFRTSYPCIVVTVYEPMSDRPEVARRLQYRREAKRRKYSKRYHKG